MQVNEDSSFKIIDIQLKDLFDSVNNRSLTELADFLSYEVTKNLNTPNKLSDKDKDKIRAKWAETYPQFMFLLDLGVEEKKNNESNTNEPVDRNEKSLSPKQRRSNEKNEPNFEKLPENCMGNSKNAFRNLYNLQKKKKYFKSLSLQNDNWELSRDSFNYNSPFEKEFSENRNKKGSPDQWNNYKHKNKHNRYNSHESPNHRWMPTHDYRGKGPTRDKFYKADKWTKYPDR